MIPGIIMFGIFGATGQALYNKADETVADSIKLTPDGKQNSWLNSKWSPMKVLSDAEYENMLREKLLSINAQISLVDESIEAVRRETTTKTPAPDSTKST